MKIRHAHLLLAAAALLALAGCASIGAPLPPSLELPKAPSDLRAARKGDKVTLTWSVPVRTTDRQSVRYLGKTQICRSVDAVLKQCDAVGEAEPPADFRNAEKASATKKLTARFVDTLSAATKQEHAAGFATYAVEVLNTAGRGAGISNQVRVALVPTLAPFQSFAARVTAQGAEISWECAGGGRAGTRYLLRIYRRAASDAVETRIAEIDITNCVVTSGVGAEPGKAITSFLDESFEWEQTYFYRSAVVSVVQAEGKPALEVEGDDTPDVEVFAHDVYPPGVPAGLQAVFSGPGQQAFIDLIWAPATDRDLDGYNVYRREEGGASVKLNSEVVRTPAYRDGQVEAGKTYFYSVSAVDVRGNESGRSEEAAESAR